VRQYEQVGLEQGSLETRSVIAGEAWSSQDGEQLKQTRERKGIDRAVLARRACLSALQVTQLEEGGLCHFYTPQIKKLAGKRAMAALESIPARVLAISLHHDLTDPTSASTSTSASDSTAAGTFAPGSPDEPEFPNEDLSIRDVRNGPD
jgi:hypothetical protein